MVHKSFLRHTPVYISHLLTSVADVPARSALRASSSVDLVVLRTRRRIGDRAFSVATPWNMKHGTGCRHSWSCCGRPILFVANWKHFCSSLPTDTGQQTDHCFVMRPRSSVRGAIQMTLLLYYLVYGTTQKFFLYIWKSGGYNFFTRGGTSKEISIIIKLTEICCMGFALIHISLCYFTISYTVQHRHIVSVIVE